MGGQGSGWVVAEPLRAYGSLLGPWVLVDVLGMQIEALGLFPDSPHAKGSSWTVDGRKGGNWAVCVFSLPTGCNCPPRQLLADLSL